VESDSHPLESSSLISLLTRGSVNKYFLPRCLQVLLSRRCTVLDSWRKYQEDLTPSPSSSAITSIKCPEGVCPTQEAEEQQDLAGHSPQIPMEEEPCRVGEPLGRFRTSSTSWERQTAYGCPHGQSVFETIGSWSR